MLNQTEQTSQKKNLTCKTKLFYGIGDIGNAVNNSAFQFFLMKFFTDIIFVSPAIASSALLIAKIWDAIVDPLFGWISDKTNSRLGKRKVYLILGAFPLAVSISLVWLIPMGLSNLNSFLWIAGTFILFGTMWTVTNVPYYSLSAELTDDYDERSSLTAYRMIMAVPAYILGAALTPAIANFFPNKQSGYQIVGISYGILAAIVLWVAASGIKEKKSTAEHQTKSNLLKDFFSTLSNKPFLILITAFSISNIAFTLTKTFIAYFLTYQMHMESQIPVVMFLMLFSVIIFLFPWKFVSEHWNKGPAYGLGLFIGAVALGYSFFLPNHSSYMIYIITIIAGIGFSATWVFPWSMVPDVVDYDTMKHGICRSGLYFGMWGLTTKLTEAIGLAICGWVLQLSGYIPNQLQNSCSLRCIKLFFGPIPAILFLVSIPLLFWFPITRKVHETLKKQTSQSFEKEAQTA